MARGLLSASMPRGHREAPGLGAILLTLALSFAAQNAVTALRCGRDRRSRPAVGSAGTRPRRSGVVPGALLTIASAPPGGDAGKHAAKRGPGDKANGEPMGRSVNWGCMSHVVPGSSWLLAQDTSIWPAGAGLAGWAWAE